MNLVRLLKSMPRARLDYSKSKVNWKSVVTYNLRRFYIHILDTFSVVINYCRLTKHDKTMSQGWPTGEILGQWQQHMLKLKLAPESSYRTLWLDTPPTRIPIFSGKNRHLHFGIPMPLKLNLNYYWIRLKVNLPSKFRAGRYNRSQGK